MMTPAEAESGLRLLPKPIRLKVIEEWLQCQLSPETRAALRKRYLEETNAADR